jgi:hypothetical protein
VKSLLSLLGNSTAHKCLGLLTAGFAIFGGPGVASQEQVAVAAIGAAYAAVIHLVDSCFNSDDKTGPTVEKTAS